MNQTRRPGEEPGNWQPGDPAWAGSSVYGLQLPEACDVGAMGLAATNSLRYPGGHPIRDASADAEAEMQTLSACLHAQARHAQAANPEAGA